jgi:ribonucleoside-diphosphate reductase beta chain
VEALLALGQAAAGAWGGLVSPDATERAVRIHRNRLRAVGIKFF